MNDFAAEFLAIAKKINPNARLVTREQKLAERAELDRKRAEAAKNAPPVAPAPYVDKYPLGGYDPISNRSYSD